MSYSGPRGKVLSMDKALACHTGSRGSNPYTTEDFFNDEKIISAPILLGTHAGAFSLSPNVLE